MTCPPDDERDLFAIGDAIASDLLASLAPLRFAEAVSDGECDAAFRLRYRAVVERGMAAAEEFPDGLERDEFDADAVHILGWDGDQPIAVCRLTLPSAHRPLPIEAAYGIGVDGSDRVVEWGRVVVDPGYRGAGHRVFMGLAGRGWLSMRARGFTRAVGATPARLVTLFDSLGFGITVLGPPRLHWGEERCPILCDGRTAIPGLEQLWAASEVAKVKARQA